MAEVRPIDANALLGLYKKWLPQLAADEDAGDRNGVETCTAALEDAPTLDYEPVRHGEWMPVDGESPCDEWVCTNCKSIHTFCVEMDVDDMHRDFWRCPKCGAKMDGGAGDG